MMKETVLSRAVRLSFSGTLVAAGLLATPAMAQNAGEAIQRVEITGSSIKRLASETVLPVTVIRQEDIVRTGATSAQDLVNLIPGNFGGTVAASNVGATGVASTANLRALGAKYTLVLLNGRRVANFAVGNQPVDLNSIPLSAIERIEVLRDGASAVYGADAVAGVINFILKKDYKGLEATVYATKVDQGGGQVKSYNITGGFGDLNKERFNVLFSYNHEEDDALHAKDRAFANTANRPDLGINKASPRNGVPNLNFSDTLGNKYTGVNPYRYADCKNDEFALVTISATGCGTDYVKFIDLIPEAKHDNFVSRAVFNIDDNHQLYAEAAYTKDHSLSAYSPAPYTKSMVYPSTGRFYPKSITLPKGMTLPKGYKMPNGTVLAADTVLTSDMAVTPTGNISGTWRTVAGGPRTDLTDTKNTRFVIGAKGEIAGWDYDTGITYGKNQVEISFGPGKFSYAKLTPLVSSGEINVFGSQDATSLAKLLGAQITGFENGGTSTSTEFDFKASKEIFQLPAGGVGFSAGFSHRKEKLEQVSSPTLASGDEVGGAGEVPGVTGSRKVTGLFTEMNIPIVKSLEGNLAARYDKYENSFGTSFNNLSPKVGVTWRPDATTMIRASAARGFRAPTLYDNLLPYAVNNTSSNFSDPIRCPNGVPIKNTANPVGGYKDECSVQLDTRNGGSKTLEPEKSKQFTLGVVFQPSSAFSGSVDYWNVKINKAIQPMSENTVMGDPVRYAGNFYRFDPRTDPDAKNPIVSSNPDLPLAFIDLPRVNSGQFFASGFDLNLNFRKKSDWGNWTANLDSTLYATHGYQYQGEEQVSDLGKYKDFGPVPRYRQALTVAWAMGAWNASVTHNYTDGYEDFTDPAAVGADYPALRKVAAYKTIDMTIGWKAPVDWLYAKSLSATFGIKNLLDTDPPSSRTGANFQTGYDAQFTNPLGRTFYFRVNYKFM